MPVMALASNCARCPGKGLLLHKMHAVFERSGGVQSGLLRKTKELFEQSSFRYGSSSRSLDTIKSRAPHPVHDGLWDFTVTCFDVAHNCTHRI